MFPDPMGDHNMVRGLKQSANLSVVNIHIHTPVGGVRTGSRHQADGTGAGAEELGA